MKRNILCNVGRAGKFCMRLCFQTRTRTFHRRVAASVAVRRSTKNFELFSEAKVCIVFGSVVHIIFEAKVYIMFEVGFAWHGVIGLKGEYQVFPNGKEPELLEHGWWKLKDVVYHEQCFCDTNFTGISKTNFQSKSDFYSFTSEILKAFRTRNGRRTETLSHCSLHKTELSFLCCRPGNCVPSAFRRFSEL